MSGIIQRDVPMAKVTRTVIFFINKHKLELNLSKNKPLGHVNYQ
jgi:hypothetical protein